MREDDVCAARREIRRLKIRHPVSDAVAKSGVRSKAPRFKADRGERHRCAVMHMRRAGGAQEEQYYLATCSCDWEGDVHEAPEPAFEEARRHSPNVSERLERPLG